MFFLFIRSYLVTACNGRLGMQFFFIYVLPNNETPKWKPTKTQVYRGLKIKIHKALATEKEDGGGRPGSWFRQKRRPSACHSWLQSWRMIVYIYYITAFGNSVSLQLGSSCQGNRYVTARPSQYKSHLPGHCPPAQQSRAPCRASPPW